MVVLLPVAGSIPFIIMMAVPGALVGILWMLCVTGTTLNVPSR